MSRFLISNLREGPEEFRRQLPISGQTIEIRLGPDGQPYFSARLDEQIMHRLDPSAIRNMGRSRYVYGVLYYHQGT